MHSVLKKLPSNAPHYDSAAFAYEASLSTVPLFHQVFMTSPQLQDII
jgi:hypothetical protein